MTPKNWASFQHYKDRSPAWIKLHRKLLDDFDFHCLPVASRALAPMLWLLASEYEDGRITATVAEIAFRLRMSEVDLSEAIKPLINKGFFMGASVALADCKQGAIPEREKEKQDKKDSVANATAEPDLRTRLFTEGLRLLAEITGRTPDSCRSLVGRWLKLTADEALHVLAAIEDAHRNRVADPTAWINKTLQSRQGNGTNRQDSQRVSPILAALEQHRERFERAARDGDEPRPHPTRLLSNG